MSSETAALHKILKDDINRKILELIHESGGLSYTELIEKLEIISDGLLNYHLKVLGKLLSKNEEDQYTRTETGRLALKILSGYPKQETLNQKKWKTYVALGAINVGVLILVLVFYSQGYIIYRHLQQCVGVFIGMMIGICIGYWAEVNPLTAERPERSKKAFAVAYIMVGSTAGSLLILLGTAIASVISVLAGGPNLLQATSSNTVFFFSYIVSSVVIGGVTGYFIGKKEDFRGPKWTKWIK